MTASSDGQALSAAWADALERLGADPAAGAERAQDLVARYGEAHRHYHSARHVVAVLQDASWLAGQLELDDYSRAVLAAAVCAHDVVYDARPGEDERASASWAADAIRAAGGEEGERVAALVAATLDHAAGGDDVVAAVLFDADLAILGSPPERYGEYVTAVRSEYSAVPDDEWRTGRAAVLTALLDREPIYLTAAARERWEATARANIAAELARLTARASGPELG